MSVRGNRGQGWGGEALRRSFPQAAPTSEDTDRGVAGRLPVSCEVVVMSASLPATVDKRRSFLDLEVHCSE